MTMTASGSKTDQIYDALRTRLMQGHYQFGEVLSTYELAQEFGVSRRPVMDAAMRLASEGFISIIPQVGCRVIIPDEDRSVSISPWPESSKVRAPSWQPSTPPRCNWPTSMLHLAAAPAQPRRTMRRPSRPRTATSTPPCWQPAATSD